VGQLSGRAQSPCDISGASEVSADPKSTSEIEKESQESVGRSSSASAQTLHHAMQTDAGGAACSV